jgi:hypothetical protein
MGTELNEDLIEATIRRVAEAKAAQAAASGLAAPEGEPPEDEAAGEADPAATREAEVNRIDAMIKHVAASKAARLPDDVPAATEDPIEATIRRVAAEKVARLPAAEAAPATDAAPQPAAVAMSEAVDPDEDPIESTIRRVVAEKAARLPAADAAPATDAASRPAAVAMSEAVDPDDDPIEATIRRVAAAKAAQDAAEAIEPPAAVASAADIGPAPEPARPLHVAAPALARRQPAPAAAATRAPEIAQAIDDLRRELDVTRRALEALTARVDALASARPQTIAAAPSSEDDWDDAPSLPRIPSGQPIRPAIFRDPSPQTATAERLEPEPEDDAIDTRPLPKPLPPLQPVPKRGFDLLPRTYRVTVEDKRRGVDLVPLHRALLGMDGVRDMSLLSYSNGTAIVSLDTLDELNPDALCQAIARAMARDARIEVHNEQTMVVKLAEE